MKTIFNLTCCLIVIAAGHVRAADPKAEEEELARLAGTWRIVSYEKNGEEATAEQLAEFPTVTFTGRDYKWSNDVRNGKIAAIDLTKKPKTIDYLITDSEDKGKTELAIYELEGDTFKDCLAEIGAARPTEFSAKRGSGNTLIIYKRVR